MSQLQELTPETLEQMINNLKPLHDAPIPEIAIITNAVSAMCYAQDWDYLSALASVATDMSAKCLQRLPSKMILSGNVAPEGE
jgi:hypothetical protein